MKQILIILLGFALGFGLIFLIKLGQGGMASCPQCGQQHWVNPKKISDPVCKKCGTRLKIQRRNIKKKK